MYLIIHNIAPTLPNLNQQPKMIPKAQKVFRPN